MTPSRAAIVVQGMKRSSVIGLVALVLGAAGCGAEPFRALSGSLDARQDLGTITGTGGSFSGTGGGGGSGGETGTGGSGGLSPSGSGGSGGSPMIGTGGAGGTVVTGTGGTGGSGSGGSGGSAPDAGRPDIGIDMGGTDGATNGTGGMTGSGGASGSGGSGGGGGPVSCVGVPAYMLGTVYLGGNRARNVGNLYQCRPYPYSPWCGQDPAYAPGVGYAWGDAWTLVGRCQ